MIAEKNSKVEKMMQATLLDRPTTVDVSVPVAQSRRHALATRWYRTEDGRLEARWLLTTSADSYSPRAAIAFTTAVLA